MSSPQNQEIHRKKNIWMVEVCLIHVKLTLWNNIEILEHREKKEKKGEEEKDSMKITNIRLINVHYSNYLVIKINIVA